MWGGVGRGKTWLMDLFFQSLPFKDKQRSHFHRFMQSVHDELKKHKDSADPLELVAEKVAQQDARVVLRRVVRLRHRRCDAARQSVPRRCSNAA